MSEQKTLVEVQHLQQYFPAGGVGKNRKYVQAVDDVSFAIRKGETLGLVGESGCGKTTTGRTLLRLYEPTGGKIYYDGNLLFDKEKKIAVDMLPYRRRMQIVFQGPGFSKISFPIAAFPISCSAPARYIFSTVSSSSPRYLDNLAAFSATPSEWRLVNSDL